MTFLIAEIGINHNGSLMLAKKLIKLAKESGFDAVKFQKRNPNVSTPEKEKKKLRDTPWGLISYLDYKKKIELSKKDYDVINNFCKRLKIEWFASAWDIDSLNFLDRYKLNYNKIASALLKNEDLTKAVAKKKKHTFISTGGAKLNEINKVIKIFKKNKCNFTLMHSVSIYPCKEQMLNLSMLKILKKKFKCDIGYSGHESSVTPSVIAASLGATAIERHVTLDRTLWGSDQSASLGPDGMKKLCTLIKKVKIMLGDGNKNFLNLENQKLKTMKYW